MRKLLSEGLLRMNGTDTAGLLGVTLALPDRCRHDEEEAFSIENMQMCFMATWGLCLIFQRV